MHLQDDMLFNYLLNYIKYIVLNLDKNNKDVNILLKKKKLKS